MAIRDFRVLAPGLADLRRAFTRVNRDMGRALNAELRATGNKVRDDARRRAPNRSGRLSRSIRTSVRAKGVSIYSASEYAPVHEFGGEIQPKGTAIEIKETAFLRGAVDDNTEMVEEELGRVLDGVARRTGFH